MDTPRHILEVAEKMFAEHGYHAVSLRSITRACNANIAAVHYHFGSKEVVLDRIFEMRCADINNARVGLLNACVKAPGRPPILEQVLDAYFRPALALPNGDERARSFMRLRASVAHEQAELSQKLVAKYFNEVSERFIAVLMKELNHLSPQDVYWRFHFLLGSQYYTLANPGRIQALSNGLCNPSDPDRAIRELVAFAAAGLRGPSAGRAASASISASSRTLKARK